LFLGQEGVATVLGPEQFAEYGLPHPREYSQAPDLVVVAQDGYGTSGSAEGETFVALGTESRVSAGLHGFVSNEPKMNAVCILLRVGIRRGVLLKNVQNVDIAPTVARLLSLTELNADGRVLKEALVGQYPQGDRRREPIPVPATAAYALRRRLAFLYRLAPQGSRFVL
jgi:hypothetical protein